MTIDFLQKSGTVEKKLQKSGTFQNLVHFDKFLNSNFQGQQRKSKKNSGTAYKNPSKWSAYRLVTSFTVFLLKKARIF